MPNIIVPIPAQTITRTLPDLRRGLAELIQTAVPEAHVYSRWPLKYSIGDTVELLRSNRDNGRVHAWIMAVNRIEPDTERKAGGNYIEWDLSVRIWGFVGYEFGVDDDTTQDIIENEARLISSVIYLNRLHLGLDDPKGLKNVGLLTFDDIDVHGMESSGDVHVAQGTLAITLSETYQL